MKNLKEESLVQGLWDNSPPSTRIRKKNQDEERGRRRTTKMKNIDEEPLI